MIYVVRCDLADAAVAWTRPIKDSPAGCSGILATILKSAAQPFRDETPLLTASRATPLTQSCLGHGGMPNLSKDPRVMLAMSKWFSHMKPDCFLSPFFSYAEAVFVLLQFTSHPGTAIQCSWSLRMS